MKRVVVVVAGDGLGLALFRTKRPSHQRPIHHVARCQSHKPCVVVQRAQRGHDQADERESRSRRERHYRTPVEDANYDLEEALMNLCFRFALDLREGSNTR